MNTTQNEPQPFIRYLTETLAEDRAALAALRRGLGQPPGYVPEMLRYVTPFLPEGTSWWHERCLYMIASLFALHPANTTEGNLGAHLALLKTPRDEDNTALERRFTVLLSAHPDELDVYLRQVISQLKTKEIAINWDQLLRDVRWWNHPDGQARVRRAWAQSFWGVSQPLAGDETE